MRGLAKYKYMMKQLTHPPEGGWEDKVRTIRWKWREREMKMRWKWQWDESYLTRTRRGGTQTQREGENTNTWKPSPPRANPERGRKKKTEADGNGTRPAEGGEDGSAWTNLHQRNLHLPGHAKGQTYLERGARRNTWNRGFRCKSSTVSTNDAFIKSCKVVIRLKALGVQVNPWTAYVVNPWITCTNFLRTKDHQKEKSPNLQACPDALSPHVKGLRSVSWEREIVGAASGYKLLHNRKNEASLSGQLFNTSTDQRWEAERWTASSLYLNELLGWKL